MEREADRAARNLQNKLAKWRLEALASRANSHIAHLSSPFAVANCALCRTSTVGRAVLDWVWTLAPTNRAATYPINWPTSTSTVRTPDYPRVSSLETTAEVSLESSQMLVGRALGSPPQATPSISPGSDMRSQMVGTMPRSSAYLLIDNCKQMRCNDLWAPSARRPLLPDRDVLTTNAWHKAYNVSPGGSMEDGEEDITLWPHGVCACSCPFVGRFIVSDISLPLNSQL